MRLILLLLLFSSGAIGQQLTGTQLLDKAIAYHDPQGNWESFIGNLTVTMSTPNKPDRESHLRIDLPSELFQITMNKDGDQIQQAFIKDSCQYMINGVESITAADLRKHKITCDRTKLWRNYYTYLYGLPMKLKDSGTNIDPVVQEKEFKGKTYKVLKATYDAGVGKDTWYFYFDPETYAMEIYQFFKVEANNDGEYILLTGEEIISGIKMPKTRAWYYNKADKYLGTDELSK